MYVGDVITIIILIPIAIGAYWAIGKTHIDPLTGNRYGPTHPRLSPLLKFLFGVLISIYISIFIFIWSTCAYFLGAQIPDWNKQIPDLSIPPWPIAGTISFVISFGVVAITVRLFIYLFSRN